MKTLKKLGLIFAATMAAASAIAAGPFNPGEVLTAAKLNNALATSAITGGTIDGAVIGSQRPAAGSFSAIALGSPLSAIYGGTGVANSALSTITINGDYPFTFNLVGPTVLTFPPSGAVTALGNASTGTGTTLVLSTSPSIGTPTITGTLDFPNAGQRLTARFSGTPMTDRFYAVTNVANAQTTFAVAPNGLGSSSAFRALDRSDVTNAARISIISDAVSGTSILRSAADGTGTIYPLVFSIDASEYGRLATDGSWSFSGLATFKNGLSISTPTTRTATAYTVLATDTAVIASATALMTLTLPAASSFPGRVLIVRTITGNAVVSTSSNVVPLAGGAASATIVTGTAGKWSLLQSDGSSWQTMMGN